jgi:hypothetical protein
MESIPYLDSNGESRVFNPTEVRREKIGVRYDARELEKDHAEGVLRLKVKP